MKTSCLVRTFAEYVDRDQEIERRALSGPDREISKSGMLETAQKKTIS